MVSLILIFKTRSPDGKIVNTSGSNRIDNKKNNSNGNSNSKD